MTSRSLFLTVLVLVSASAAIAGPGAISPRVEHALERADGPLAVWVYFVERDLSPAQLETALERAETALDARTARRRGKTLGSGRLVDRRDLSLDPRHLELASATGAIPRSRSRWLRAASFDATPAQIRILAALPCVRRVDLVGRSVGIDHPVASPDAAARAVDPGAKDWTLDYGASQATLELINVPPLHELGYTGDGVLMAMLDSGFHMTHEAIDHVPVLAAYDFVGDDGNVGTEPGDPPNAHSHGTQCLSAMMALAPGDLVGPAHGVTAILARAEQSSFSDPVEEDWWVAALEWVEAQGADIVSSSLGYWVYHDLSDLDGDTAASTVAADMAVARGLLVVNAAGNLGGSAVDVVVAPADGDSVIAVGMTDVTGAIAPTSSSGPTYDGRIKPDVVAQGMQVAVVDAYDDHAYGTAGGTSLSCPLVAGVAALILERAPFLTPMQVREALRQTADRADAPDNDYGWGLVDAVAAAHYWGPWIEHAGIADTEDSGGPYSVNATVTDLFDLDPASLRLRYRVDGGAWRDVALTGAGGDAYRADIPGQPFGSTVEYYLEAADVQGLDVRLPLLAPAELFGFDVRLDTEPPILTHAPLRDQPIDAWPPHVTAGCTDNIGVESVAMEFSVNGGAPDGPHPLVKGLDDRYALAFPLPAGAIVPGDVVSYTISAADVSVGANTSVSGPHAFTVIAGSGEFIVLDDGSGGEAAVVAGWLNDAGYSTTFRSIAGVAMADLEGMQAVVYLCGTNDSPTVGSIRFVLQNWVAGGGRILVEGGEVGFSALTNPAYATFCANVLHAADWRGDESGSLQTVAGMELHPLLRGPVTVQPPLAFDSSGWAEQDAVTPLPDARLVLETADVPGAAGALVFDDAPIDPAAQTVYFPFALSALADQEAARGLVVNAVALLTSTDPPTAVGDETPRPITRLTGVSPNPFNPNTMVRLELGRDGPARLDVYDVHGRLVRRLLDAGRRLEAGTHEVAWDGRDERGRSVGSGVYFARLIAGAEVAQAKMLLVR